MPVITRATPKSPRRELYAQSAVLPSESANEFAALFEELCQELKPVGLLEEDLVATIAKLLWRKHRVQVFHNAEQARAEFRRKRCENRSPLFLDAKARARILARYVEEEEAKLAPKTDTSASPDKTKEDMARIEDMASVLAPRMEEIEEMLRSETEVEESADEKEQAALRDVTPERYINDLEMVERLDADVERAFARLQKYQTKRMTGSLSPPAAQHRAPHWGRVRQ